ncbi:endonuclease/exonuclease/phosphatase family protein [Roseicella aquatilis]|uniref:endonuclease/exonuclease/phosphatase family protein n=1 Tax=Roseicella aquatilis TaxID=2527868 RepID=UPI00104FC3BF|nr:endonuclease/exonuclease/phosphatase family protein [Roseicella aquatilis]
MALVLIAATALPLAPTDDWWVRAFDFPRPQLAVLLALGVVAALALPGRGRPLRLILLAGLLAALGQQLAWLWPYTPLHTVQTRREENCAAAERLSVVIANLRAGNNGAGPFLEAVRAAAPDLVFVVEVDPGWVRALRPLEETYPHRLLHPRDDFWGFALYARLDLIAPEARHLLSEYVPSARAGIRLRSGAEVGFHGLHPKPPLPGEGTGQRDAELLLAAEAVRQEGRPAVLGGDLNSVAWSDASVLARRIGGLLDPRIGRGPYVTFPTWLPQPLRFPIDHILATPEFRLLTLDRLPDVGSDHLPLLAVLCHAPDAAMPATPPSEVDRQRVREAIRDGREDAARATRR